MERDELGAWLRLLLTPGVGNATARQLLAAWGGPHQVFAQSPAMLASLVGPRLADVLLAPPPEWTRQLDTTWAWLQADPAHHVLTLADAAYPPDLLQMPDPPILLFVHGSQIGRAHV